VPSTPTTSTACCGQGLPPPTRRGRRRKRVLRRLSDSCGCAAYGKRGRSVFRTGDKSERRCRDVPAYSEWANNVNWCDLADNAKAQSDYQGRTELKAKHDGTSVVDWGSLQDVQNCNAALACAATWYDEEGNPVESDIRFSTAEDWSINAGEGGYDIQSAAAHEFGHVRQFDHVTSGDNTVVMWPYISKGDTSLRKLGRGDARGNNTNY